MKKALALLVLSTCMTAASFASNVVGHSAKVAGKETAKTVTVAGKSTAKAGVSVVKILF